MDGCFAYKEEHLKIQGVILRVKVDKIRQNIQ